MSFRLCIDEKANVMTAELYALQLAADFILEHGLSRSIIIPYSQCRLEAIYSPNKSENP